MPTNPSAQTILPAPGVLVLTPLSAGRTCDVLLGASE